MSALARINAALTRAGNRLRKSGRWKRWGNAAVSAYVDLVFRTTKWDRIGFETFEAQIAAGGPHVMCCWHERLMFTPYLRDWSDHGLTVIASRHADAQTMTQHLAGRGIETIQVRTSHGNTGAIRDAVRCLKRGRSVGVTVDGPFGPPRQVKPGALTIAGLAGVPATPCSYAVRWCLRLPTWDRFVIPLPFSRGVFGVAEGFTPPARMGEAELAAAQTRMGTMIDDLTAACEAYLRDGGR